MGVGLVVLITMVWLVPEWRWVVGSLKKVPSRLAAVRETGFALLMYVLNAVRGAITGVTVPERDVF